MAVQKEGVKQRERQRRRRRMKQKRGEWKKQVGGKQRRQGERICASNLDCGASAEEKER